MRFSCGETDEALAKKYDQERKQLQEWHPFFVLWPRTVGSFNGQRQCVWLEWIVRRGKYLTSYYCSDMWFWEYKSKELS